jgi:HK97 family phage portal protein
MNLKQFLKKALSPIWDRGRGWLPLVREPYTGAWQQNKEVSREQILTYHAVYSAMTLIASDIAKLPIRLVKKDRDGIWEEIENPAYSPVLRKPNPHQTRIQFFENWVLSLLSSGNTYVLLRRDRRNIVIAMYVLDPSRVQVLTSESGEVFYQLSPDAINGIEEQITVPASEIIHDRVNPLYHPLCGISPIVAAALPVLQGRSIQDNAVNFFANNARPGGILTAAGAVSDEMAEQLRKYWKDNYTGNNAGGVAVLADGLTYKSFDTINAQNSQALEQLNWTAEVVCSVFHVPPYKIGIGETPSYNNIEALNVEYYSTAIQSRLEHIELLLDEGLRTPNGVGTEFLVSNLLRMDSAAQMETLEKANGKMTPNEQRKVLNLKPVVGGDSPMVQMQNFSLAALAKRDAKLDPFANDNNSTAETVRVFELLQNIKGLSA